MADPVMKDQMTTELTLTVTQVIAAPQKRVYDAWLDPAMLARFMVPCMGGTVPEANTDPRVGGRFRVVMNPGDQDIPHEGTYLDLVPHSRIAFSWESPHSVEGSRVTLDFVPVEGGTRIDLLQVRFASKSSVEGHRGGWTYILGELARVL